MPNRRQRDGALWAKKSESLLHTRSMSVGVGACTSIMRPSGLCAHPPNYVAPWAHHDGEDGSQVSHGAYTGDAGHARQAQRGPAR